jgi:hypothetical protein
VRKADNLTNIYEPIAYRKCGSLDVPQTYGPSWRVTEIARPFFIVPQTEFQQNLSNGLCDTWKSPPDMNQSLLWINMPKNPKRLTLSDNLPHKIVNTCVLRFIRSQEERQI